MFNIGDRVRLKANSHYWHQCLDGNDVERHGAVVADIDPDHNAERWVPVRWDHWGDGMWNNYPAEDLALSAQYFLSDDEFTLEEIEQAKELVK